ncbi:hypothetical protein ACFVTP_31625 [Streptomyces celluloflavus]|uniref:hypothetical protein n=1 Tax=Streptomyces celluloflavus TaxID=58344 RepID=UPI0036D88291
MDLTAKLSGLPGVAPLEGIPDAWHWSPNPRFNFFAALTGDGDQLFQINVMDTCDQDLVRALLRFAREHNAEATAPGRYLIPVDGFSHPGYEFDTMATAPPEVHGYLKMEHPELHSVAYAVFPGYRSEFSGSENEEEARTRVRKMLRPTRLDRSPVPFVKMRYHNTRTKSSSTGTDRGFTTLPVLMQELDLLQESPGSFVEWENRRSEVWQARWDDSLQVQGPSAADGPLAPRQLLTFAEKTVTSDHYLP